MKFLENIFSVKNKNTYKVVTILGMRFKIKSKYLVLKNELRSLYAQIIMNNETNLREGSTTAVKIQQTLDALCDLERYKTYKVRDNSVLMAEVLPFHGECLPGIAKYFLDLGFNVDVLFNESETNTNPFKGWDNDDRLRIFKSTALGTKLILNSNVVEPYKYIYINSALIGNPDISSVQYYNDIHFDTKKMIHLVHSVNKLDREEYKDTNAIALTNLPEAPDLKMVNAHYFGEIKEKNKNSLVNFIVVGNIEKQRKNFDLLLNTIKKLHDKNIRNFKVTMVARIGNLKITDPICESYIDFKGSLSYAKMYEEMKQSDYFMTLLDPDNKEHHRYVTNGTSGSFQLIYGFLKPCLIAEKFASIHRFNNKNSIIYKQNNELLNAMEKAINMSNEEYLKMQSCLRETTDKIYQESLENLKEICKL